MVFGNPGCVVKGSVVDVCKFLDEGSSNTPKRIRQLFEPWELHAIKEEALKEYAVQKMNIEILDLAREEKVAREDIVADAMCFFEALNSRNYDKCKILSGERKLMLLLNRLKSREALEDQRVYAHEQALREEGRAVWRQEVEENAAYEAYLQAFGKWKKEQQDSLRAACAFLMGSEVRFRRDLVAEESNAWNILHELEEECREEAQRIAYENLWNSPEQVALREEQRIHEERMKRRYAKQLEKHLKDQEMLLKSCRHGRGGTSVFEGAKPRTKCVPCGVVFSKDLGYYVRTSGKTVPPPKDMADPGGDSTANFSEGEPSLRGSRRRKLSSLKGTPRKPQEQQLRKRPSTIKLPPIALISVSSLPGNGV